VSNKTRFTLVDLTVALRGVACAMAISVVATSAFADPAEDPPALFTEGMSYGLHDHIVSTSVFIWYPGQASGPWLPLDGLSNWNSSVKWWRSQVKQMMTANIDVLFVHLVNGVPRQNRKNLFQALNEMRAEGYDVPKVAPFLDTAIIWSGRTVDLATTAGKDEFIGYYIDFFSDYYSANADSCADDYLTQIDGRVVLDCYVLGSNILNVSALTRSDVETRLKAAFGAGHPVFGKGIYMIQIVAGADFTFTDEVIVQFENNSYYHPRTHNNIVTAMVKAGYWDQNIRDPGDFLARDGGVHYESAWNSANSNPNLERVYVESWSEYDEGSGIYAVDVANSPHIAPGNPNTDTWSDTGDPWEYIKTTAAGARQFNQYPDQDSKILWHNFPGNMEVGEHRTVTVVVRNMGDLIWTGSDNYKFGQKEHLPGEVLFGPGQYSIDDDTNEIPLYGGIFRGRPIALEFDLIAPNTAGTYETHWGMLQEHAAWFGEELSLRISVGDSAPSEN